MPQDLHLVAGWRLGWWLLPGPALRCLAVCCWWRPVQPSGSIAKSSSESCSILIRLLAKKIACTNNANWEMWGCSPFVPIACYGSSCKVVALRSRGKIAAVFQCCIACILIDGRRHCVKVKMPLGCAASYSSFGGLLFASTPKRLSHP